MQTNGFGSDIAVSGDLRIAVIGVGGAGCRIVSKLYGRMGRVGTIAINTDRKALEETQADTRLFICKEVTKGVGSNGDPALGKKCAQIHDAEILSAVRGKYDYAFIVAGMGGGTGSGAAPVVAELCDRAGIHVGAITVMPFGFESDRAIKAAEGYRALHAICKDIVRCENEKILSVKGIRTLDEAMMLMNDMIVKKILSSIDDAKYAIRSDIANNLEGSRSGTDVTSSRPGMILGAQKSN